MNNNIDNKFKNIKTKSLSQLEKDTLWQGISNDINKANNLSFFSFVFSKRAVINIAIAILVIFGGFIATVQAADKAKPGDVLYALDRAVENIQITFASSEDKDKLKIKFAQERASEIQDVVEKNIDQENKIEKDKNENRNSKTDDIEESSHDALKYIIKVRNELFEKNDQTAVEDLDTLLEKVQDNLSDLPDNMKVDIDIEEENNKSGFRINFKDEDGKFKIKYKVESENKENTDEEEKKIETRNQNRDRGGIDREDEDREDND